MYFKIFVYVFRDFYMKKQPKMCSIVKFNFDTHLCGRSNCEPPLPCPFNNLHS